MRYPLLATALSLVFGSSVAFAADNANPPTSKSDTSMDHKNVQNVDLFFDTDSAELAVSADSDLQALADWAKCDSKNAIILEGYADPRGTKDHNLTLSGERAASVRQKLIDMGVPSRRIVVTLYGENGKRKANFQQDRRVTARATGTPITPEDLPG
jgi:outer membrane protein OmpA-like peptidoglycan-associated protein